ncbi:MAG: ABC transporter ATP-binding protein [Moorea sp. SIOASIH]|uniref:ABC transporter ATP-binding protein n=1 Tax=Moorena sp. SIOASIH TaxID=2607817 RepID=UPI0013BD7E63|nr:ABC transporter ATP-binding protein [Moorena sp. SIOASIH]NEO41931.1 ABC transporter ATP-binding protein [Moorena sp. SIOASIH]
MVDAIIVQGLGKRFNYYHPERPLTIMEAALSGFRHIMAAEGFWALRNITFTVSPGQMLGILGHNGAGKSTLLRLIGGVGKPDEGKVRVNGSIGALLDLGAGFHPDLTGRENAFVSGVVAGLTRQEVGRRFDEIVTFAELEQFIDNPVRTYSTGMQMRLAFSVAVHTDPDVMLVDEFLSVGDLTFQAKCLERIAQLKESGCAIVLISHSSEQIEQLCDRALWLQQGQIMAYGEPKVVAGQYVNQMRSQTQQPTPNRPAQLTRSGVELRMNENRFGSLEVEITDVLLLPSLEINSGDSLAIDIKYLSLQPIDGLIFSVIISTEDGHICLDTNSTTMGESLPVIKGKGKIKLHLSRLDLNSGKYFVDVGVYEPNWAYAYDYHWHVYQLLVRSKDSEKGILSPPLRWDIVEG